MRRFSTLAAAILAALTVATSAASAAAPVATSSPAISGDTYVGATFTSSQGTWTGSPTTFAYVWYACTTSCATDGYAPWASPTHVLPADDLGKTIKVLVEATNASGTTFAWTQPVGPVTALSFRYFASSSIWNTRVDGPQALDPNAQGYLDELNAIVNSELSAHSGPWINSGNLGARIYTVSADQPTVSVGTTHQPPDSAMLAAWSQVPMPADAQPAPGENDFTVFQPSSDTLWELYQAHQDSVTGAWTANWGGAIHPVSGNRGVYDSSAWDGAKTYWGTRATSFPFVGGAILASDMRAGVIPHALELALPNTSRYTYTDPAERHDGPSSSPTAMPEGAHLRVDPTFDLTQTHCWTLPLCKAMAQAAQRYGVFVGDTSGVVAFTAEDPATSAWPANEYGGLYPWQLLFYFPWSHLQLLQMTLH